MERRHPGDCGELRDHGLRRGTAGRGSVVFSNESASYGSIILGSGEVNHQWSKGWVFESAFGSWLQTHVAADLHYYSLLRPLSELAVARQFARVSRYDAHFLQLQPQLPHPL